MPLKLQPTKGLQQVLKKGDISNSSEKNQKFSFTRRRFIQTGSLFSIASLFELDPVLANETQRILFQVKENYPIVKFDVLRSGDLLNLNVKIIHGEWKRKKIHVLNPTLFRMIIQIPPQHIAEELVLNFKEVNKRKKSFLSQSSYLVFRLREDKLGWKKIPFSSSFLLNWNKYFHLVSFQDVLKKNGREFNNLTLKERREILCEYKSGQKLEKMTSSSIAYSNFKGELFSHFEMPFNMHLGLINEPKQGTKFERLSGHFLFSSNRYKPLYRAKISDKNVRFNKLWESEIYFKDFKGELSPPRFKVVNYSANDPQLSDIKNQTNCDPIVELLPAPDHRRQLHELTLLPFNSRDVQTEYFRFSALGGSTKLKYENLFPVKSTTIVKWEQIVKYARDNYVAITFRALDVFTNFKLLISIVADRKFKDGKSFLLKRYFITYAEREKSFDDPVVIGKTPFKKIKALSEGIYFTPVAIENKIWHHVQEENVTDSNQSYKPKRDIVFNYLGLDATGNEIPFSSKIIFIPAESYHIVEGEYCYSVPGIEPKIISSGNSVDIGCIGGLNPKYLQKPETANGYYPYRYKIESNFLSLKVVQENLKVLRDYLSSSDDNLIEHFSITIENKLTFANIENLKRDKGTNISSESKNSTFNTQKIFLFSSPPEKFDIDYDLNQDYNELDCHNNNILISDNFNAKYPLIPFLHHANLVIPQITQIEGREVFRNITFADSFVNPIMPSDFVREDDFVLGAINEYKLLFKLISSNVEKLASSPNELDIVPLQDFFTSNYKGAGAVCNPGITIENVSVLKNGIIFKEPQTNDLENFSGPKFGVGNAKGVQSNFKNISAKTIFGDLEAEICGINLLGIIEDFLPIEELPEFNYQNEIASITRALDQIIGELSDDAVEILELYNSYKQEIATAKANYENVKKEFDKLKKEIQNLKKWQSSMRKEFEMYFEFLSLQTLNTLQKDYLEKLFSRGIPNSGDFERELKKIYDVDLIGLFDKIRAKETLEIDNWNILVNEIHTLIKELIQKVPKDIETLFLLVVYSFFKKIEKKNARIDSIVKNRFNLTVNIEFLAAIEKAIQQYKIDLQKEELEVRSQISKLLDSMITGVNQIKIYLPNYLQKKSEKLDRGLLQLENGFSKEIKEIKEKIEVPYKTIKRITQLKALYNSIQEINYFKENQFNALKDSFEKIKNEALNLCSNSSNVVIPQELCSFLRTKTWEDFVLIPAEELVHHAFVFYGNIEDELFNYEKVFLEKNKIFKQKQAKLIELKNQIEKYGNNFIDYLDNEYQRQIELLRENPLNEKAQSIIGQVKLLKAKIAEISTQKFVYNFELKKFKDADLLFVRFKSTPATKLSIDIYNELKFRLDNLQTAPALESYTIHSESELIEFQISFLELITIDFAKVKFTTGTDVNDEFDVQIKDVQFAGSLSFVEMFQQFLSQINENLIFAITEEGAVVGLSLPIPFVPAGPFQIYNLNFVSSLLLPFNPQNSLQLTFGIGSPHSKFAITYTIFGGQGYFQIIVEPKRGIVGLEVVMEFGAIFYANIGVASGEAYLVGGIYIRKYNGIYTVKAYVLCVGRFSVAGIITASASFYVGMESYGGDLSGKCVLTFKKKFFSWTFKVSVSYEQTIKKPKEQDQSQFVNLSNNDLNGLKFVESNINEASLTDSTGFLILMDSKHISDDEVPVITVEGANNFAIQMKPTIKYGERSKAKIITYEVDDANNRVKDMGGFKTLTVNGKNQPIPNGYEELSGMYYDEAMNYYKSFFI